MVGGGTAGVPAAIEAARNGCDVVLVEAGGQLGGTMTTGGVSFPGLFHAHGRQIIAGKILLDEHAVHGGRNTEGSNLDGGKKGSGNGNPVTPKPPVTTEKPVVTTTTKPATTTTKPATTTTKPVTTTEKPTTPAVTTTVSSGGTATLIGDANMDGKVTIADSTAILQSLGNPDKYALSAEGAANADCCAPGSGVTTADALTIQKYDAKLVSKLPVEE